ncbi:MAG: pyridoxal phosphate-dependent aminotransferase [Xenococcaceae cyanobacterium MO_188.B32]|nr:pyridoxal phosphate-dependent aminotransferase [Xenococcaceae cyanobacterium MO_188.B32]
MKDRQLELNSNSRMKAVQSPLIPVVGEWIRQNPGTISLGQGVVSYPPPPEAIAAVTEFLADPVNHKYQAVEGIPDLRKAIEHKLNVENKITIDRDNCVVVTAGSNMAFMNAILAITSAGDEIILNTPYYFNHEMAITMANCRPVLVPTDKNYQLQPDAIAKAITSKTKAVVTISPNNPTGVVYSASDLAKVNQICRERGIYHISDEAYEYFTYEGVEHFSPASLPESESHTISLFSLSKAYGFASWRIGYMVIPQHLLMPVKKVQDTNLICPPVISQYAALGALKAGVSYCCQYLPAITLVRDDCLQRLTLIREICTVAKTAGAFYFFLKINTDISDFELAKELIQKYKVATIPGGTFGIDRGCYLRVAYGALQSDTARDGIQRLVKGLQEIV